MKPIIYREDPKKTHQNFLALPETYSHNSNRFMYFLAACSYFSQIANFDFDIAFKLRLYGGLIGIDNSSWDNHLNNLKILRHAFLHVASGFIHELYNVGPVYLYMLSCKINSCFSGHLTSILFGLYIETFQPNSYQLLEC